MTALIFNLGEEQVVVAMDTLVTDTQGAPVGYTSKLFPLMHLGGVMCVTGVSNFAHDWLVTLQRFVARDMKHLDDFTPPKLQQLWEPYAREGSITSTVYHFGFAPEEQRYVGFAYRSANDFESERLNYALGVKPAVPDISIEKMEDFVSTMCRQREQEDMKDADNRLYVGGEIQLAILENREISLRTGYRFPDYDDMYESMCYQFPLS